jgi:hypothetical protein
VSDLDNLVVEHAIIQAVDPSSVPMLSSRLIQLSGTPRAEKINRPWLSSTHPSMYLRNGSITWLR